MSTNGTSIYRRIGRVLRPVRAHRFSDTLIAGALTIGNVVACATGDKPFPVTCALSEAGAPATLVQIILREYFASGSAVKAKLRVYFLAEEITTTKGAAFYANWDNVLGYVDVQDTDWLEVQDNATASNGGAIAIVKNVNLTINPALYSGTFYAAVVSLENDATGYATGAKIDMIMDIEEH